MSHGPQRVRESEVRRLIRAAQSAGVEIGSIKAGPDGCVSLILGKPTDEPSAQGEPPDDEWKTP